MTVSAQINLYFTDEIKGNTDNMFVQHHCFYYVVDGYSSPEIIPFCLSEPASKWHIEKTNMDSISTFAQLNQKKITSEQLYSWSAPIDVIERYQFYLNQLSVENQSLEMEKEVFYNCTSSTFGSQCEYKLDIPNIVPSMHDNIYEYYRQQFYSFSSIPMTCYVYLKCDRGLTSVCLDWTEICDGKVDCSDGIDEQHCSPLTTNVCQDNEYRCDNGQCIPSAMWGNDLLCLDRSDQPIPYHTDDFITSIPSFKNEDEICSWRKRTKGISHDIIGHFTSSCKDVRHQKIEQAMFLTASTANLSNDCLLAFQCYGKLSTINSPSLCLNFCQHDKCLEIIENTCTNMFFYPTVSIVFGHIYFAYTKQYIISSSTMDCILPEYICYNEQMCSGFPSNITLLHFQERTCHRREDVALSFNSDTIEPYIDFIGFVYSKFGHCNQIINAKSNICNNSFTYQCENSSKCIPISYIGDGIRDCDYEDDEKQITVDKVCSLKNIKTFYKCANENKCIHRQRLKDDTCDCQETQSGFCDDEKQLFTEYPQQINYLGICDSSISSEPILIDGQIHTDETECEQWPCNNRQTRCNYAWDCPNGADELDCYTSPPINCSSNQHVCVSPHTNDFMCLPIEKINDNVTDCLGDIDESAMCPQSTYLGRQMFIYCKQGNDGICWTRENLCIFHPDCDNKNIDKYCQLSMSRYDQPEIESVERIPSTRVDNHFDLKSNSKIKSHLSKVDSSEKYYCHHGLPLQVVLNSAKGLTTKSCLCPPSYYGDRCQYQNQRVSLILQMNTPASSIQTPFLLIASLIDNSTQRTIHSYWQLFYLYQRNENDRFDIQLVYSNRPKDLSKQYFIQIDIYEMVSLRYRGSMFTTLKFPFLPVERVVIEIKIPKVNDIVQSCDADHQCNYGQCIHYLNERNSYFCQCQPGWTGEYCDIPHTCSCSSDSLCVGVTADNRSICLCSLNKFGSKCLLSRNICQPNPCLNGGFCVFRNNYMSSVAPYVCVCPMGFRGKRCQEMDNKIIVSFDQNIQLSLPSQIFLFFIEFHYWLSILDATSAIVCESQTSTISYASYPSDMLIIQLSLSELHLIENNSSVYNVTVNPLNRCPSIHEVFNESIANMHLIRRIKHYNVPCQNRSANLRCFHDSVYMCLCQDFGDQRLADCVQLNRDVRISNPIFTYDEMEHLCFANNQIDFSTSSTSSTTSLMSSTANKSILTSSLTSVILNQSNITKSLIDITTSSNSAYVFIKHYNDKFLPLVFLLCVLYYHSST